MAPMAPRTTGEAAPTTARGTVRPRRGRSRCATSAGVLEKRAAQGRRKRLKGRAGMERLVDWDEDPPRPPPYCCPYPCPYCTLTPSLLLPLPVSLLYTHSLPTVAPTRVPTVHSLPWAVRAAGPDRGLQEEGGSPSLPFPQPVGPMVPLINPVYLV